MIDLKDLQKEGLIFLDMHSHTNLSDGSQSFQEYIEYSKKNNFNICITDHNEIKGSLQIKDFTLYGSEVTSSECMDLLVYFDKPKDLESFYKHLENKRIKEYGFKFHKTGLSVMELIDFAKNLNALIAIPHPHTKHPKKSYSFFNKNSENKQLLKKVDAVEVMNSMMSNAANKKAIEWAKEINKAAIASSDAHSLKYLGYGLTACYASSKEEFIEQIRKKKSMVYSKEINNLSRYLEGLDIMLKNIKLGK